MAIVWEKKYPGGGVTRIVDDAYRDASPEEIERRFKALEATLSRLLGAECTLVIEDSNITNSETSDNTDYSITITPSPD